MGLAADFYHFNINDFIGSGEIDGRQVLPVEFAEHEAEQFIDIDL